MVSMDEQQEEKRQNHQSKPSSSSMARREEAEKEEKAKLAKSHPAFLGRHRMSAAIFHLNNQITTIQEELNELETVGKSSTVCKELISSLETIPDPLLPTTEGPIDADWDRWFRGAHNSKGQKRWI